MRRLVGSMDLVGLEPGDEVKIYQDNMTYHTTQVLEVDGDSVVFINSDGEKEWSLGAVYVSDEVAKKL